MSILHRPTGVLELSAVIIDECMHAYTSVCLYSAYYPYRSLALHSGRDETLKCNSAG